MQKIESCNFNLSILAIEVWRDQTRESKKKLSKYWTKNIYFPLKYFWKTIGSSFTDKSVTV